MLFISRYIYSDDPDAVVKFGVVDTDDGVEEVITEKEVHWATEILELKILGADLEYQKDSFAAPYQYDPITKSGAQMKLEMFTPARIVVYKNAIASIELSRDVEDIKSFSIRLSDYADSVADLVLTSLFVYDVTLTLILDDKLKSISPYAFRYGCEDDTQSYFWLKSMCNVCLDVSEMSDPSAIYEQVKYRDEKFEWSITDKPERLAKMRELYGVV